MLAIETGNTPPECSIFFAAVIISSFKICIGFFEVIKKMDTYK